MLFLGALIIETPIFFILKDLMMGNLNIKIEKASNLLFILAVLLITIGFIVNEQLSEFLLIRSGVLCSFLSAFYAIYSFEFKGKSLKAIWSFLASKQTGTTTTKESIWLYQPFIFGMIGSVLALYSNPWI